HACRDVFNMPPDSSCVDCVGLILFVVPKLAIGYLRPRGTRLRRSIVMRTAGLQDRCAHHVGRAVRVRHLMCSASGRRSVAERLKATGIGMRWRWLRKHVIRRYGAGCITDANCANSNERQQALE